MSYNLLLNTEFKEKHTWNFTNCKYENGKLISNSKVFGIEQELILPDVTKLYARINYLIIKGNIKDVYIGIQNKDVLNVDRKAGKLNKKQKISVIDVAKQEKIKFQLIFESLEDINEVQISEPLLIDLNYLHKSTWLKFILDRTVHYISGYTYQNEYKVSEIKPKDFDIDLKDAKIGSIISTKENVEIELEAKFNDKAYYLVKLDLEEINQLGKTYFKYGVIKSTNIKDQCYLVFKANQKDKLKLVVEANDVLDYKVNLKHLLLTNITKLNLLKSDIPYIPFVGD